MIVSDLLKLYMSACGEAPAAFSERYLHVNDAYRKACARLDLDQLEDNVSPLTTTAGVDYVTLPTDVFHLLSVHNQTRGIPIQPEPSGMRGRERYLEAGTGMPASGEVVFYAMAGTRLYLRGTPDAVITINTRYKLQPPLLSDSDLASSLLTPSEWDLAIVAGAAASFLRLHADADQAYGDGQMPRSQVLKGVAEETLAEVPLPKERERFDQRGRLFMPFWLRR